MSTKIQYSLLIGVSLVVTYFFVTNLITVFGFAKNPLDFGFKPIIIAVSCLVSYLFIVGLFLVVQDRKDLKMDVEDVEEWWTKWDQV